MTDSLTIKLPVILAAPFAFTLSGVSHASHQTVTFENIVPMDGHKVYMSTPSNTLLPGFNSGIEGMTFHSPFGTKFGVYGKLAGNNRYVTSQSAYGVISRNRAGTDHALKVKSQAPFKLESLRIAPWYKTKNAKVQFRSPSQPTKNENLSPNTWKSVTFADWGNITELVIESRPNNWFTAPQFLAIDAIVTVPMPALIHPGVLVPEPSTLVLAIVALLLQRRRSCGVER